MGRRKMYPTPAARQAAYRQRTCVVDCRVWDNLQARLRRLHEAIARAQRAGQPIAAQVIAGSVDTTIEKLTDWFAQQELRQKEEARKKST